VAGCAAALSAARSGSEVALLTKLADPEEANTRYAQGGIIYTGPDDSPELLAEDVLVAGAGAGHPEAAALLAAEGPPLVRKLLIDELAVPFDRDEGGFEGLHLTREGAHSVERIVHHRDTTGSEVQRALTSAVEREERVTVLPGAVALDLVVSGGRCTGVHAVRDGEPVYISGSVVLATGGLGGLYEHTTNPPSATGDGVALALRAGATVRDLHYVQFHPTALYAPEERFLISEAVRGEGGVLRDARGREFVDHPLGALAPRDVVAREIASMMERTGSPCAYLDLTHLPGAWVSERFPAIMARCLAQGLDFTAEPIPVLPAAHYACGGVAADGRGRTSLPGLWAAGEVARTGLHGANRLASTSLLEGLVWGWRSGGDAARTARPLPSPPADPPDLFREPAPEAAWGRLRSIMWQRAGLVRTGESLREGLAELSALERSFGDTRLRGPLLVARTVLRGALLDGKSRGCHYRRDAEPGEAAGPPQAEPAAGHA
nr:L-aspartate oxidase [Rubrobacter sp.]